MKIKANHTLVMKHCSINSINKYLENREINIKKNVHSVEQIKEFDIFANHTIFYLKCSFCLVISFITSNYFRFFYVLQNIIYFVLIFEFCSTFTETFIVYSKNI